MISADRQIEVKITYQIFKIFNKEGITFSVF